MSLLCEQNLKKMPIARFNDVKKCKWSPIKLEGESIPQVFQIIPDSQRYVVYANGGSFYGLPLTAIGKENIVLKMYNGIRLCLNN